MVRLQERLLSGILRLGGVPEDQVGDAEGEVLVLLHELAEGRAVASARPGDDLLVIQWLAVHGANATPRTPPVAVRFPGGARATPSHATNRTTSRRRQESNGCSRVLSGVDREQLERRLR